MMRSATSAIHRTYNFSAGPAVMPEEVLQQAREDLWSIDGTGIGILEHSHRGPVFDRILQEAEEDYRSLAQIPDDFAILFLPGGMTQQFALAPMNFLQAGDTVDVLHTGAWTAKAMENARRFGRVHCAFDGSMNSFRMLPSQHDIIPSGQARYLWYCSNNTIEGTQYPSPPAVTSPLMVDASSDIFSRPLVLEQHAAVFASAQKNLGPAGISLAIIHRAWLDQIDQELPGMLSYRAHAAAGSRLNTPPTFGIYMIGLVLKWISHQGGLASLEASNKRKAALLYDTLDRHRAFYRVHPDSTCRSQMNVVFRTPSEDLDRLLVEETERQGMSGLAGHRSVGGLRASIYNAFPEAGCTALAQLLDDFAQRHG